MKKLWCVIGCLALLPVVEAAPFMMDLSPKNSGTIGLASGGITASGLWGYDLLDWHGTWEKSALSGQVGFSEGTLNLQVGGVASLNAGGNFAGVKFSLDPAVSSAALSFDIKKGSTWGSAAFDCAYTCNIYGFAEDGASTIIGTWSVADAVDNLSAGGTHVSIDLHLEGAEYASYGLIFNACKTGNTSGGMGADITNLRIDGQLVPEPSTASLGLAGLAALLMRRRKRQE